VEGAIALREEEGKLLGKIEKMKKMAMRQQEKVDEIKEWAEIVIDKNNRKLVYKTMNEKREYLQKIKAKNDLLEMYLNELQAE
jgi:mevalonate kinase